MASVDITIVYTVEVPELDEVEFDTPEGQEIISDIYNDWGIILTATDTKHIAKM